MTLLPTHANDVIIYSSTIGHHYSWSAKGTPQFIKCGEVSPDLSQDVLKFLASRLSKNSYSVQGHQCTACTYKASIALLLVHGCRKCLAPVHGASTELRRKYCTNGTDQHHQVAMSWGIPSHRKHTVSVCVP
jgi:hypothetical protein